MTAPTTHTDRVCLIAQVVVATRNGNPDLAVSLLGRLPEDLADAARAAAGITPQPTAGVTCGNDQRRT